MAFFVAPPLERRLSTSTLWGISFLLTLNPKGLALQLILSIALILSCTKKRKPKFMMPHMVWYPPTLLKVVKKQGIQVQEIESAVTTWRTRSLLKRRGNCQCLTSGAESILWWKIPLSSLLKIWPSLRDFSSKTAWTRLYLIARK